MKYTQALAKENVKYELLSYSLIVTILLYVFGADLKVFGAFLGGTVQLAASWLITAYNTYKRAA